MESRSCCKTYLLSVASLKSAAFKAIIDTANQN